jgi:glucose/arabinose dehydrogenase
VRRARVPRDPRDARLLTCALALLLLAPLALGGATLPSGFSESAVATGLASPTAMAVSPDGRIFVCEQGGKLRVIKNGSLLAAPFATVTVSSSGERGLLGVALDPGFPATPYVYLYYTATSPTMHNRVSRFTASGDVAAPGSEVVILDLDDLSGATNHNGGAMHFGPDGKLYVATGENAYQPNAQDLTNLHGKILRINPDGSIPSDNPFYVMTSGRNRAIWALGLRNPFTFAFQPGSGRMLINDVGGATWEEINEGASGANYGWPAEEGPGSDPSYVFPVYEYSHGSGSGVGCAITGGTFYDPSTPQFPVGYVGSYFFADFCSGWIERVDPDAGYARSTFASNITRPVDLRVAADGSLYYLARGSGSTTGALYRIQYGGSNPPAITQHPAGVTVSVGQPATFTVSASGTPPLSYQWQRNGTNISGATGLTYTLSSAQATDNGAGFRCRVTNAHGTATSNAATLTVVTNAPPAGSITQPAAGATYAAGDTILYAGTGTDSEDGTLAGSAFTWQVDFHHDSHSHPVVPPTSGALGGSFTVPTAGETSANVWHRVHLTVRDSAGATHSSFRDVLPRKATLSLEASPAGAAVTLDGQAATPPLSVLGVVGASRVLGAVTPQTVAGASWEFDSWSDGGAASHSVATPASDTTYTAVYRVGAGAIGGGNGLDATYWDNSNFTGASVQRLDPFVAFDWKMGGPAPGIAADTFSVRWTGEIQPQFTETYTFFTQSDDGVRLWVNGALLIDNWTNHALTENSGSIALAAGQRYAIRMEFYENGGGAVARLLWASPSTPKSTVPRSQLYSALSPTPSPTPTPTPGPTLTPTPAPSPTPTPGAPGSGLTAEYYDTAALTSLKVTRTDPTVNFNWGAGSPAPAIAADTFSARWSGEVEPLASGTYTFYTQSDDGVRLWVAGQLLVDNWTNHRLTENSGTIALSAGQRYAIRMEYYEYGGDAVAKLLWSGPSLSKQIIASARLFPAGSPGPTPTPTPTRTSTPTPTPTPSPTPTPGASGLQAQYFDGTAFNTLKATRTDPGVNFQWGTSSPAAGVPADRFSARWTGRVIPQFSETYRFYTTSDDGVRLWVAGQLVVDNWTKHAAVENSGTIALSAGQSYDIRLEFFDYSGDAIIKLSWSSPSQSKQIVPASRLLPP